MSDSETEDCLRLTLAPPGSSSRSAIASKAPAGGNPPPYLNFNGINSGMYSSSSSSVQDVQPGITQYSFNIMQNTGINQVDYSHRSSSGISNLMEEAATWALRPPPETAGAAAMAASAQLKYSNPNSVFGSSPIRYNNTFDIQDKLFTSNLFNNLQQQQFNLNSFNSLQQQKCPINGRLDEMQDSPATAIVHHRNQSNHRVHPIDDYIINRSSRVSDTINMQKNCGQSPNPNPNPRSFINSINTPLAGSWTGLTRWMESDYSNGISADHITNDMSTSSVSEHSSLLAGHNQTDYHLRTNPNSNTNPNSLLQQDQSDCSNYNTNNNKKQGSNVTSPNPNNNNNIMLSSNTYRSNTSTSSSGGKMHRGGTGTAAGAALSGATSTSSGKEERIAAPYPWAAERRAAVEPVEVLKSRGITRIWGEVSCKKCEATQRVEVEVEARVAGVSAFFVANRAHMHDRAPPVWYSPRLLDCHLCRQTDCVRPSIAPKKRCINWLFLLLTQTLGLCTLEQLKYFCKHNRKHRTGAKDRVLYLTYSGLLKQLQPSGPYD